MGLLFLAERNDDDDRPFLHSSDWQRKKEMKQFSPCWTIWTCIISFSLLRLHHRNCKTFFFWPSRVVGCHFRKLLHNRLYFKDYRLERNEIRNRNDLIDIFLDGHSSTIIALKYCLYWLLTFRYLFLASLSCLEERNVYKLLSLLLRNSHFLAVALSLIQKL